MLPQGHDSRSINIHGGQGGPGGEGRTGGPGGDGHGPIVHITAQHFTTHNMYASSLSAVPPVEASQIVNHCPPPSRIFQGRQKILDKMHHFFTDGRGGQHIYVLHGLGGAGKTQIALKFIKDQLSSFSDIFFIDTSGINKIDTGLKNIAIAKHVGQSSEEALQWLAHKVDQWLLFFDNADDPSINLNQFLPQCDHGNIIITSRNRELCHYAGSHSLVSDLEEIDAVALLLKSACQEFSLENQQIGTNIVKVRLLMSILQYDFTYVPKTLGYLALAIVQAGAFIFKSGALDSYLDLYAKHRKRLLSEKPAQPHDSYAWAVYTTWQMSFDRLQPQAAMLLQLCSFLHYKGITEEIFSNASRYRFRSSGPSKEELQRPLEFLSHFLASTGEWDSLCLLDVTNEIRAYSLIDFDSEKKMFSIHPLVHAWSREIVRDSKSMQSTVGTILGMAISQIPHQDINLASVVLLPHVESVLGENLEVGPYFREVYAQVLSGAGKYKEAEKLRMRVLEKCRDLQGDNHPDTLKAMSRLAATYSKLGEFKKAQELEFVVLEKRKQSLGDNNPHTLNAMGNLASTYRDLGEFKKAQELRIVVLEKRKQSLGDNHPDALRAMGNLASTYRDLGEFKKAQELEIIVLEKQKQLWGDNHPNTLHAMGNLAATFSELGEFKKAQELQIVVLEKQKQFLGDNHLNTLNTMGNLALQQLAVPKAQIEILCFGMFWKNSRYLNEFCTDSHET